ncbi:MAG: hypothetical protein M3253_02550, partial [Chloroflexota bacterium]|nr:hypothetical protein [Chloroflexota bacterium]
EYDPQGIHLNEQAAHRELFGGIVASGWHSLAATMRLMVEAQPFGPTPLVGVSIDRLRFLQPVRPTDMLRADARVLGVRRSRSRPDQGFLRLRITTHRQGGEPVLTQEWTMLLPRRSSRQG